MTVVAAVGPDGRGSNAVHLAGRLAASTGEDLVLCCVVADAWGRGTAASGADADWRRHLEAMASEAVSSAREGLPPAVISDVVVRAARSVPRALVEEAERVEASMLVVGSSGDARIGHLALGSVASWLLHRAPMPVMVAPRAFWSEWSDRVERVVLAVDSDEGVDSAVGGTVALAKRAGVGIALVTFGVRRVPALPDGGGRRADDDVFRAWQERVTAVQDRAAALLEREGAEVTDLLVAVGDSWRSAVDRVRWLEGDLLVMTSSREGPLRRIFLGSNAPRIMTRVPVPVVTLPRR
ncbi:universal stress protein [Mumia sp. zg.B53]|uniref:universal stress protein n=1 Tax=Mumia sp. zg.B53 TaxID=2855449 RepID=UPI001C6F4AB1|nr:universal stress protein [Mumia sp. zg.B53]MBW9214348.1 universal stress protein [Mumia sp. zg.B53]